jgi:hypothetical protein
MNQQTSSHNSIEVLNNNNKLLVHNIVSIS